ncbi:hypothetical protein Bca101_027189 [Brassica carinata]
MRMDLQLPSDDIIEVELEYEKLEKHCFLCKSLSHEDEKCPAPPLPVADRDRSRFNISQQNTLDRIEEGRKRQADRKYSRMQQRSHREGARWTNYKENDSRGDRFSRENHSRLLSERSSGFEENRRRYDDRPNLRTARPASSIRSPYRRVSKERSSTCHSSQDRNDHVVSSKEIRITPTRDVRTNSRRSPQAEVAWVPRNSLASRLSDPRDFLDASEERIPVKDRLSIHTQRTSKSDLRESLSGSKIHQAGRIGPGERSPIRTLSEDRIHVSLRLGTLLSETESDDPTFVPTDLPALPTAEGKRKLLKSQKGKSVANSPLNGTSTKRRRVSKVNASPRRKLMMDAIVAGGRGLSGTSRSTPTTRSKTALPKIHKTTLTFSLITDLADKFNVIPKIGYAHVTLKPR